MPSDQNPTAGLGRRSYLAATAAFKDGSDTPRDFLERCLEIIEAQEERVGAIVSTNLDGARKAADEAGTRWKAGKTLSPIDGMPIGIKDIMETADMPTGQGSGLFTAWEGKRDCAAVAALREAGAVIVAKMVTTHPQPLGYGTHAGRLQQRLGCRGGDRHATRGPWIAGHRLDHSPKRLLRRLWLQTQRRRH